MKCSERRLKVIKVAHSSNYISMKICLQEYILYVINLHRKALRENKVGSAIPHLDKKLFKAIEVPVPPYDEQVRISYCDKFNA